MIPKLEGMFETIDYQNDVQFLILNNFETDCYPKHWHNAVEIIMPIQNTYRVILDEHDYQMKEYDILIIPAGNIHEIIAPTSFGQRLFIQFDISIFKSIGGLSDASYVFLSPWSITSQNNSTLHHMLKSILLEIFEEQLKRSDYYESYIIAKIAALAIILARSKPFWYV